MSSERFDRGRQIREIILNGAICCGEAVANEATPVAKDAFAEGGVG